MSRTLKKTLTYSLGSSLLTVGVLWAATGSASIAVSGCMIDRILKVAFYFGHEIIWHGHE